MTNPNSSFFLKFIYFLASGKPPFIYPLTCTTSAPPTPNICIDTSSSKIWTGYWSLNTKEGEEEEEERAARTSPNVWDSLHFTSLFDPSNNRNWKLTPPSEGIPGRTRGEEGEEEGKETGEVVKAEEEAEEEGEEVVEEEEGGRREDPWPMKEYEARRKKEGEYWGGGNMGWCFEIRTWVCSTIEITEPSLGEFGFNIYQKNC